MQVCVHVYVHILDRPVVTHFNTAGHSIDDFQSQSLNSCGEMLLPIQKWGRVGGSILSNWWPRMAWTSRVSGLLIRIMFTKVPGIILSKTFSKSFFHKELLIPRTQVAYKLEKTFHLACIHTDEGSIGLKSICVSTIVLTLCFFSIKQPVFIKTRWVNEDSAYTRGEWELRYITISIATIVIKCIATKELSYMYSIQLLQITNA